MQKPIRPSILLATCAVLAAMPSVARAEIVLAGGTQAGSYSMPTSPGDLLTLGEAQQAGSNANVANNQSIVVAPTSQIPAGTPNVASCGTTCPAGWSYGGVGRPNDQSAPTPAAAGWDSGANVGIGFAPNQAGATPIMIRLDSLSVTLYGANGLPIQIPGGGPATFNLGTSFPDGVGPPITFTGADTPGGNLSGTASNPFLLRLNAPEAAEFDALIALGGPCAGGTTCNIGINSSMSFGNSAADIFFAFAATEATLPDGPVPPEPPPEIPLPASFPLYASGLACIGLLGWRRKRKSTASVLEA